MASFRILCVCMCLMFNMQTHANATPINHNTATLLQLEYHSETDPTRIRLRTYAQAPRLSDVLQGATQLAREDYLPYGYTEGYRLFYTDADKQRQINTRYHSVIERLNTMIANNDDANVAQLLLKQLAQWQYKPRALINLDLDAVRLDKTRNPLLSGNYILQLCNRPAHITLVGLVTQESFIVHSNYSIQNYLRNKKRLSAADNSYVWVIEPNGHAFKTGYAYWNDEHAKIKPGSLVFMGFNSSRTRLKTLEQDIIFLLQMHTDKE